MHTAKCEKCGRELEFETYRHHWPEGWILTGQSRYGKKYHRRSGWAWWCPRCQDRIVTRLLTTFEIDQKRHQIDALRKREKEIDLSVFQRGQLAGAQQALYWCLNMGLEPVRTILTDEQIEALKGLSQPC